MGAPEGPRRLAGAGRAISREGNFAGLPLGGAPTLPQGKRRDPRDLPAHPVPCTLDPVPGHHTLPMDAAALFALVRQLVDIESTTGHEAAVMEFTAAYLRQRGWRAEIWPLPGED
ncbi:MAG: hypothetical protein ACREKE_04310, partial [bacterium]